MRTINTQEKKYLLKKADRRALTDEAKLWKPCLKYIQRRDIL